MAEMRSYSFKPQPLPKGPKCPHCKHPGAYIGAGTPAQTPECLNPACKWFSARWYDENYKDRENWEHDTWPGIGGPSITQKK